MAATNLTHITEKSVFINFSKHELTPLLQDCRVEKKEQK